MAVTHSDIAKAACVDRTTVSRALSGRGRMNEETRNRIKKIAADMNYRLNRNASNLASGRSDMIGLLMESSDTTLLEPLLGYAESKLRQQGYVTSIITHSNREELEIECIEHLIERKAAGVIAMPSSSRTDPTPYRELLDNGIKVVLMDKLVEGLGVPSATVDNYKASHIATEYLLSLGHRDIVYMALPLTRPAGRERCRGFTEAMEAAGIPVTPDMIVDAPFGLSGGQAAMAQLLKREKMPTAIVTRHDLNAIGAMRAMFAAGFSIPDDISIVGYVDMWCNDIIKVPLTSVRHPGREVAVAAAKMLINLLANPDAEVSSLVLSPELVIRSSCAPPRAK